MVRDVRNNVVAAGRGSAIEAFGASVGGVAMGFAVGNLVTRPLGIYVAIVAGLNGLICGWRRTYDWTRPKGWLAFALDSTWSVVSTTGSLLSHVIAVIKRNPGFEPSLSVRQNRHVYRLGMQLKPGFALTLGNVTSGAGDISRPSRHKMITDHEDVHIWQARWLGPVYPLLYGAWTALGSLAGVIVWLVRGRKQSVSSVVQTCSYYLNPFEYWAYSRDDVWPPAGLVQGIGWRKPVVRPLAMLSRRRPPTPVAALTDQRDSD